LRLADVEQSDVRPVVLADQQIIAVQRERANAGEAGVKHCLELRRGGVGEIVDRDLTAPIMADGTRLLEMSPSVKRLLEQATTQPLLVGPGCVTAKPGVT